MFGLLPKTLSVAKALLSGQDVSQERLKKRLEICNKCDKVDTRSENLMSCSICGCKVKQRGLVNLARYEETKDYGCKHPKGSRWKDQNV